MLLHWANAHGGLVVWPRVGEATPPNPCKPLGLLAGPPPHHQVTSCPSCTSWGQVVSFYLSRLGKKPPAASDFHNFHMWSLKLKNHSIVIYISLDTHGHLTCSIWASIEEIMHVQTSAVSGATPRPQQFQGDVPGQRPTQIVISPSSHLLLRCSRAF